jgi:hypothetical protein
LLTVPNLTFGTYTIAENFKAPDNPGGAWYSTTGDVQTVNVPAGGTLRVEFGNAYNPRVPASSETGLVAMIGSLAVLIGGLVFWRGRRNQYQK